MPSSRTANSSPPKRATVSAGRTQRSKPAGDGHEQLVAGQVCPRLSLTTLKRSRSRNSTANRCRLGRGARSMRAFEPVDEEGAVGQPGQRIVGAAVGDVGLRARHPIGLTRRVARGESPAEHPAIGAVVVAHPMLVLELRGLAPAVLPELRDHAVAVLRMHEPEPVVRGVADIPFPYPSIDFQRGEK